MALAQKYSTIKKPHVLHIASGDLWAGAEVMLYTLAKSLHSDLGVKTTIILLNTGTLEQKLRDRGITVYVIDESQLNSLQIFKQLNKIIKQTLPDVIHTHRIKENILGSIAAWRNGIPSIRTSHGAPEHRPPLYKLPKRLILLLDKILGRQIQKYIVAVSADLAKKLEKDFHKAKIKVIENGIDIDTIRQSNPAKTTENKAKNSNRIGIAGRLVPVKRVDLFIESAFHLKRYHPELDIHYYIYGDGPLQEELQNQIRSYHADDYIHLEGHCENLTQQLQTLDALIMTSDHEGLPMVLLESMSLQTPVIAHAVGGIPHLLEQGKCGTLVYEHTAEAFAEAVAKLINQPQQYKQLTQCAFERINQNYSARSTADAYLKLYRKLSGGQSEILNK